LLLLWKRTKSSHSNQKRTFWNCPGDSFFHKDILDTFENSLHYFTLTASNNEQKPHRYKSAESQYDPEGMFIQGKAITIFSGESKYIRSTYI